MNTEQAQEWADGIEEDKYLAQKELDDTMEEITRPNTCLHDRTLGKETVEEVGGYSRDFAVCEWCGESWQVRSRRSSA